MLNFDLLTNVLNKETVDLFSRTIEIIIKSFVSSNPAPVEASAIFELLKNIRF